MQIPDTPGELRERLIAQQAPGGKEFAAYRKEVEMMLEQTDIRLRREKWFVSGLWLFMVGTSIAALVAAGRWMDSPRGAWFGVLSVLWLLYGAVELLKHHMNRQRVDVLKEIKKLEIQVVELKRAVGDKSGGGVL